MGSVNLCSQVFACSPGLSFICNNLLAKDRKVPWFRSGGGSFYQQCLESTHGGWEGMDDSHGDLAITDTVTGIPNSLVDKMSKFGESCDEVTNAVIVVDFCIMVILPCIVFSRSA